MQEGERVVEKTKIEKVEDGRRKGDWENKLLLANCSLLLDLISYCISAKLQHKPICP